MGLGRSGSEVWQRGYAKTDRARMELNVQPLNNLARIAQRLL